jgi:pimeloyl-ACP methyl ester carboxylesterase
VCSVYVRGVSEAPRGPWELLGALARQSVQLTPSLAHIETYTFSGLLTMLWHGDPTAERVVVCVGGGMGGLLGPADGLYHDLGIALSAQGIGVIRVGYRRPNDLESCVHDLLAVADLACRQGAARIVTVGHSFGGAVAVQGAVAMGRWAAGVVTLATQSAGCEGSHELAASGVPVLLIHGDRDEILPPLASQAVHQLTGGHGELEILPGTGHLLSEVGPQLRARLGTWIPEKLA